MPHLMNMPRYQLRPRVPAPRRRVLQVRVADLGLRQRDAGVVEEEVREGEDARRGVEERDEDGDQQEEEAGAGLHGVGGAYRWRRGGG